MMKLATPKFTLEMPKVPKSLGPKPCGGFLSHGGSPVVTVGFNTKSWSNDWIWWYPYSRTPPYISISNQYDRRSTKPLRKQRVGLSESIRIPK